MAFPVFGVVNEHIALIRPYLCERSEPNSSLPTPTHPTNDNNNLMKLLEKNFSKQSIISKYRFANNMTRINRRIQGESRNTISVTLPHDCVIILNRAMNRYGNNRSLAVEYIIKDWERARQAEREVRQ